MTIALWCVMLASAVPYLFTSYAKFAGTGGFDNRRPREFLATLEGARQRAYWAQLNTFESYPMFAAAAVIAHVVHGPDPTADGLAISYVVLRVVYGVLYISDRAALRSLSWLLSMGCIGALYLLAGLGR